MRTIADDLVLLLLDPESGRLAVDGFPLERAIAGALLLDLSVRNRISVDGKGARAKLTVTDATPTGDKLLDGALDLLARRPLRARRAVERLDSRSRNRMLERIAAQDVILVRPQRPLRLIEARKWSVVDRAPVDDLRGRLAAVLRKDIEPDQHLVCLVSLVHAVKAEHKLVSGSRRELRARAAEISRENWAGAAVRTPWFEWWDLPDVFSHLYGFFR